MTRSETSQSASPSAKVLGDDMSLIRAMTVLRSVRPVAPSLTSRLSGHSSSSSSPPPTPAEAQAEFWKKNERLKRPMSPWTIYKPQLTSMLSITHRGTGLGLGILIYGMGVNSVFASHTNWSQSLDWVSATFPAWSLTSLKVLVATSIGYHLINGIRHLMWDYGYGFQLKQLYTSGYFVIAVTLVVGIMAALNA